MRDRGDTLVVVEVCAVIAFVILIITIIVFATSSTNKWEQRCHDKGGHVVHVSKGEICLDSNDVYMGKSDS